jgi:hypothetical protein
MTWLKATGLTLGFAGAFGLGVWASPAVRDSIDAPAMTAARDADRGDAGRDARAAATPASRDTAADRPMDSLEPADETVRDHVRPLLSRGTDVAMAATGFEDARQFVTLAHAAHNTEIPFVVLKHRVLTEGKTLETAIRESKPELDAKLEADRARLDARAELARLRG